MCIYDLEHVNPCLSVLANVNAFQKVIKSVNIYCYALTKAILC